MVSSEDRKSKVCPTYQAHGDADENRYKLKFLMSRKQKLKGLAAASLRLKTLNDNH